MALCVMARVCMLAEWDLTTTQKSETSIDEIFMIYCQMRYQHI